MREMSKRRFTMIPAPARATLVLAALAVLASGCAMNVELDDNENRNGDINILAGSATLGAGSRLEGVIKVKAGSVVLGKGCTVAGGVNVTNGSIEILGDVRSPLIRVSNGSVEAAAGTVSGDLSVANGSIELFGTRVRGEVSLDRGRLDAREAAIEGGLSVENKGKILRDTTMVIMGPGCRLAGTVSISGLVRLVVDPETDISDAVFTDLRPEIGWGAEQ